MEFYTISENELQKYLGRKDVLLIDLRKTAGGMASYYGKLV